MNATPEPERTEVCIVGGGPAGMMLGLLLARAGIEVLVLEKHQDFFRDFRGDTIHPSTLELMHELGLLEEFLLLPHQEMRQIQGHFGEERVTIADFSHLPTRCQFIAFMPQWDFLAFLKKHAERYPNFSLQMSAEVTDLAWEGERVAGVLVKGENGGREVRARLVVGADGRSSTVRERAGLEVIDLGANIDVLWFRLPRRDTDGTQSLGHAAAGKFLVMIDRGDYWQCGYVIRKGGFALIQEQGLAAFGANLAECAPMLGDRVDTLKSWDQIRLLSVKVDRLRHWCREGLLCIGDSAHAMSPVGGIGINLAIQDAVATANLLAEKLRQGAWTLDDLRLVQRRRQRPTQLTQRMQIFLHEHLLKPIFDATGEVHPPWPMRLLETFPRLRRLPARTVGLGFRPEHIETGEHPPVSPRRADVSEASRG